MLLSTNLPRGFYQLYNACLNYSKVKNTSITISKNIYLSDIKRYFICCYMQVGQLAQLQLKRQELLKRRDKMIDGEYKRRQKERVNLDQSSVKKGYIEKTKIIAKKQFQTKIEKARKIPIELQQNVNVNTFLKHSNNYQKILARTQSRIVFDQKLLKEGLTAINSFGLTHYQKTISFTLQFEKQITCQPRPFLIHTPFPQPYKQGLIILPEIKQKDNEYPFQKITTLNLSVITFREFRHKCNNDKAFTKQLFGQTIKCFVKFELFKNNKYFQKLLKKGIPVFPIDTKKIPFALQAAVASYQEYIEYVAKLYVAVTKSGKQQIFRLNGGDVNQLLSNAKTVTHELSAKLFQRSKTKQNKLLRITIKTASSITYQIYKTDQSKQ